MLSVIMVNVIMLSVIMLSVIMLGVLILNVVAPNTQLIILISMFQIHWRREREDDEKKNVRPGNTKGESITVLLTSCLTGLE